MPSPRALRLVLVLVLFLGRSAMAGDSGAGMRPSLEQEYARDILPILREHCLGCHSSERQKGDLDLERFRSLRDVLNEPNLWQGVVDQVHLGEMPPRDEAPLRGADRDQLLDWVNRTLHAAALERAGDPGPVVLRRLNNAEYTYSIRDLTGVASLEPAREFPGDSAAGEGFMNVGQSLVMSPSLVTKYLDAAKAVAAHAVLLPDGIGFSPSTSQADWATERVAAIRDFYGRYTVNGGGSAVNLQGIRFDTRDGGVLPLEAYVRATLAGRNALAAGTNAVAELAREHGLSARYLARLWGTLSDSASSLVLDEVRARWRSASPAEAADVVQVISRWQQTLWRFAQVGHIGKVDGPKAWQLPVTPLADAQEIRIKLPETPAGDPVVLQLVATDAGDGGAGDVAVWKNPRLVSPGRADVPLRALRAVVAGLERHQATVLESAAGCLAAAAEIASGGESALDDLASRHGVSPVALAAWLECVGIGMGGTRLEGHLAGRLESAQGHDFVKGWTGADALSVVANRSGEAVRIPGNLKSHSVAVHPSPSRRVVVSWRSPAATPVRLAGAVQHAHPECGNGVTWTVELRRGGARQRLASGTAQGSKAASFGPFENLGIQPGDVLSVLIGPREGNHACDLAAVDLTIGDGTRTWDLAKDISPDILAGNPHPDGYGNPEVWHFHSEPDPGGGPDTAFPADSLLARWQASPDTATKQALAEDLQRLLADGVGALATNAPDALLHRQLTSPHGPLLAAVVRGSVADAMNGVPPESVDERFGLDPGRFGTQPGGASLEATSLAVQAPSVIEVRLPSALAAGSEFVVTAALHPEAGREGSVQMRVLAGPSGGGPVASPAAEDTPQDRLRSDAPVLATEGSPAARRMRSAFDAFRDLFPAALCYTQIVPVDEVVTLTLYYREDEHLRRLMLDEAGCRELDRLWSELHYVSHDALKLVDAFEQLWQYATQDADPSAFTPMREPIVQRAEAFRRVLLETEPVHVEALLGLADRAYRRPLSEQQKQELRALYQRLRADEVPHDEAIRLVLARVLVAPSFLYRAEVPVAGDKPGPVNDWELATRLSYFLWSSLPDPELRAVAVEGRLRNPDVLAAQARRMLADARTRRLATEFACAWLHVHGFDELGEKSERHFPTFGGLRGAMYEETIRFFTDLFQGDRSVLEIVDADHTFLNAALAGHYGVTGMEFRGPDDWRRVEGARAFQRGGVLGLATVLSKQSGASRTSPILRGNWLSEVLLGEKLPRPPKDVPQLPEDEATETLTMRQLTERHASDPRCAGCHSRIDPYGFALEAYDAIGRFREQDLGGRPIDVRTKAADGARIEGLDGLRQYLLTVRREAFLRQFCRKLLGYALGRSVLLSDGPLISEMQARLEASGFRFSTAVETIVRSRQFREIRGQAVASTEAGGVGEEIHR